MANYKNSNSEIISTLRTVPANSTKTGTIETDGKNVIGTGTAFTTEVKVGDWLCSLSASEIRKIVNIEDDTNMYLEEGFTADLAALSTIVTCPISPYKEISYLNVGSGTGKIDGLNVAQGEYGCWGKTSLAIDSRKDFVDPIIVDGTSSNIKILTLK